MKIMQIYNRLDSLTDGEITFLEAENCFQLLIGVILSAQTTDKQVNSILPNLFARFPSPEHLAEADPAETAGIIKSVGFFNIKASNIIKTAAIIHNQHSDHVPSDMEDLLELPGVGRKSANVIRGTCFHLPAIIVDTHFARTAARLDLTTAKEPEKIEYDLIEKVPAAISYRFSMLLNKLGRDFCKAQKPLCMTCPVSDYCCWPEIKKAL